MSATISPLASTFPPDLLATLTTTVNIYHTILYHEKRNKLLGCCVSTEDLLPSAPPTLIDINTWDITRLRHALDCFDSYLSAPWLQLGSRPDDLSAHRLLASCAVLALESYTLGIGHTRLVAVFDHHLVRLREQEAEKERLALGGDVRLRKKNKWYKLWR